MIHIRTTRLLVACLFLCLAAPAFAGNERVERELEYEAAIGKNKLHVDAFTLDVTEAEPQPQYVATNSAYGA